MAQEELHVDRRLGFAVDVDADAGFVAVFPVAAKPHVGQAPTALVAKQFGLGIALERPHLLADRAEGLEC